MAETVSARARQMGDGWDRRAGGIVPGLHDTNSWRMGVSIETQR